MNENINTESRPWASFCISTFKRPDILEKQLKLIAEQSFKDFEVVISDNDPEKSAEEIVKKLGDARFVYYANIKNIGMVKSFNKSIERATADYIIMATDDDPIERDMLSAFHDIVSKYPGYGIYCGCIRKNKRQGEIEVVDADKFIYELLHPKRTPAFIWSSCVLEKEIAVSIGGMSDFGSPHLADHAMLALCGYKKGGVFMNKMYSFLNSHDDNFSKSNFELYYTGCIGFYNTLTKKVDEKSLIRNNKNALLLHLYNWFIVTTFAQRRYFTKLRPDKTMINEIEEFSHRILQLPFMKKVRRKFYFKKLVFNLKKRLGVL